MTHAIGNPQLYLNQVTRQARHVMDLCHQGKHEAVRIQELRLADLISAAITLKPEWHKPLLGAEKIVSEYSLRPCHSDSPAAFLIPRAVAPLPPSNINRRPHEPPKAKRPAVSGRRHLSPVADPGR